MGWVVGGGPWLRRTTCPSGLAARVDPSGRSSNSQPSRWMQMSWWYWQSMTQSVTLVLPPCFLCLTWWTSQLAGRRLQPPGQAQPLSRAMTALRIDSGMVSEYPTSRMTLLPFSGASSRARRSADADRAGAGDELDRQAGHRVLQGLPRLGRQRGAGPGAGVVVGAGDQGDHLADQRPVRAPGHDRDDQGVARDGLGVLAR